MKRELPGKSAVTIRDVARLAEVSVSSVSNTLTGRRPVSTATRLRVEKAVTALGYSPNMVARCLVSRRSNTLGVVTYGLEYFGPSRTLAGIEREANALGYSLLLNLLHRPDDPDVLVALNALTSRRVDGLIWAVPEIGKNRSWITRQVLERLPPTVFLSMAPRPHLTVVAIDNRGGAALAVRHLVQHGRRTIGLISGPLEWWEARERKEGWRETLERAGLDSSERLLVEGDWSPESGEVGLRQLLERRPDIDAVFVANDQMALGALRVARVLRRRVPRGLAIAGFDNTPESAYFSPSLTTVSHPLMALGQVAVQKLQQVIAKDGSQPQAGRSPSLSPKLIIRESS